MEKKLMIKIVGAIQILVGIVLFFIFMISLCSTSQSTPFVMGMYWGRFAIWLVPSIFFFYSGYNFFHLKNIAKLFSLIISIIIAIGAGFYFFDSLNYFQEGQSKAIFGLMLEGMLVVLNLFIVFVLISPQFKPYFKE